jgi:hypothetical protein
MHYLIHQSHTAGGREYGTGKQAGFRRVGYARRKQ